MNITVAPQAGVMCLSCPSCKEGTVKVVLSLWDVAYVRSYRGTITRQVKCHSNSHPVLVAVSARN